MKLYIKNNKVILAILINSFITGILIASVTILDKIMDNYLVKFRIDNKKKIYYKIIIYFSVVFTISFFLIFIFNFFFGWINCGFNF